MGVFTLVNAVSWFATVTTIGQFLSGIPSCRKIVRNATTGELSCLPFVAALFSCSMWAHYGILKGDTPLILVNVVGLLIQIVYIYVFWKYSPSKMHFGIVIESIPLLRCEIYGLLLSLNSINQQVVTSVGSVILIVIATNMLTESSEEAILYQGLVCCLATCFFCAAPLATLTQVFRSRNTESLPFLWILMTFLVSAEWLVYGCLIQDVFVQFPNFVGMIISGLQLSLFLFFSSNQQHGGKVLPTVSIS